MLEIIFRTHFKKDVKRLTYRQKETNKLKNIIELLASDERLPIVYFDHSLCGKFLHHRECHIEPDWILIYKKEKGALILERTGSHADLFK